MSIAPVGNGTRPSLRDISVDPGRGTGPGLAPSDAQATRLEQLADEIERHAAAVVDVLSEVATRAAARYEVTAAVATLRGARAEVARHAPRHVDEIAVFLPSNVLLYSYVLYGLVPTLYADRVRLRPSAHVSDTAVRLHQLLQGLVAAPVELAPEPQRRFVERVVVGADVVVFAGAYANAELVRHGLRREQLFVFLGSGVNPVVVAPDADLASAVAETAEVRLLNTGQDCLGPDVVWVHAAIAERFLDDLGAHLGALRFDGDGDGDGDYGRVHYPGVLARSADFLHRHSGRIRSGGRIDFGRSQLEPTIVAWPAGQRPELTEFFSPIFNVAVWDDEAALADMLDTGAYAERAMGASLFGTAPRIERVLRRWCTTTVDRSLLAVDDGNEPLGGRGPMAGHFAVDGRLVAEPVLLSKGVADHLGRDGGPRA